MAAFGTVTTGSKRIDLHAFTGEVVEQQKSSHTEVSRDNNQPTSTTHYNKIFVRAADGAERSLEIVDSGFSARSGSKASIIWGIKDGKQEGPYLGIINHDTAAIHLIRKPVNDFAGPPFYNMLLIVAAIFCAVGFFDLMSGNIGSAIIMAGIGVGGIYWIYRGQKALLAQITAAVLALQPH
ncbi:MAG: hypothetical protein IT484_09355 [Gammaproteobacteria bacterium]|nr:hypothetical protein [Gammaproteobacteria bacterium]